MFCKLTTLQKYSLYKWLDDRSGHYKISQKPNNFAILGRWQNFYDKKTQKLLGQISKPDG